MELVEEKFHEFFTNIPSRMKRDEYHLHVRNDPMLIQYEVLGMQKKKKVRYNDISYTLRHTVKLIKEVKSISGRDVFRDSTELKELESWKIWFYQGTSKTLLNMSTTFLSSFIEKCKTTQDTKVGILYTTIAEIASLKYIKEMKGY